MTVAKRIGLLTPGWPGQNTPNGIATSVFFLATGLHQIGHTPVILARHIDGACPSGIPVVSVPEPDWRWQDRLRAKLGVPDVLHRVIARSIAAAVDEAVRKHALEVLIMEETNGWAAMMQPHVSVPIIVTLHGPLALHKLQRFLGTTEDLRRQRREHRGLQAAAGLIAPSRSVLEPAEEAVSLPSTPKIILPNSFSPEAPTVPAATLPNHDILFVGRFDSHKGGDIALEAFASLLETFPDTRLTFVGPDRGLTQPDGSTIFLDATLAKLPHSARTRIDYKGPLDRTEVARLRTSHAIALITSRYENLNYTLLEAMAAGQAIVCTAVGGPAEVLEDGGTALLVPPGDPKATAAALGRLVDDAALARRLGEAGQAKLTSDFDPAKIAARTIAFVETVRNDHKIR